jgi:ATP-dependent Clp protease ATP-binding subunit ClpC
MGARPLRRAIQRYIEDPLADFVLRAELKPGATVLVEPGTEEGDEDVKLSILQPVPAGVGAEGPSSSDEGADEPKQADDAPPPAEPAE